MSSKKKPQDHKAKSQVGTAKSWKKAGREGTIVDLELPSGNVCRVKRVSLPALLSTGAFPDSLMSLVSDKIETATGEKNKPKEVDPAAAQEFLKDPEKLDQLFSSMDKIIPIVVVEPKVLNHRVPVLDAEGNDTGKSVPIPDEDRDEDVLYTDDVDLEDKMHIFQFVVGGVKDVESFRAESASVMGALPAD